MTGLLLASTRQSPADDCSVSARPIPQWVPVVATVAPRLEYRVSAEHGGVVDEIRIAEGATVRQGEPLLVLKNPAIEKQARLAASELGQVSAALAATQADADLREREHRDRIERAKRELALATFEVDGDAKLLQQGAVSELQYRRAVFARDSRQMELSAAKAALRGFAASAARLLAAKQQQLENARLDHDFATEALRKLTVASPIDGKVMAIAVHLGETASEGQAIATVASDDNKLVIAASNGDASRLEVGMVVQADDSALRATIVSLASQSKGGIVNAEARIEPQASQDPGPVLRPGATLLAKVMLGAPATGVVMVCANPHPELLNSEVELPLLSAEGGEPRMTRIRFGEGQRDAIVVHAGARPGDRLRVSVRHD